MPLPKIKASGGADVIKADDRNDSLDTFIRQAIGKEPFLSFSRANDSPVQWMQLLHALDQQDLPGWPLMSPLKVQMQKCDKCSREFCSTINYRRHMRLHRRNLNLDKDSTTKNRGLLQAFWDKLSMEETMEIMTLKDVSLEGVTGCSIIKALTSFVRKPGFTSLPQSYVRAGSALLDIVQARPSRFPVSSQELFGILDDASEKTFLCAGTAESLQKYVFDGEAGKIGLEMTNLVACTSFLVEQKLVKACLADKDAEALRYQKLLVEEEEAAQKRQAALLEKKRQKKLRQKEQREKDHASAETDYSPEDRSPSPPTSGPVDTFDSNLEMSHICGSPVSSLEPVQILNLEDDVDKGHENGYPESGSYQNVEHKTLHGNGRRHVVNSHWQAPKLQKSANGFHISHSYQVLKPGQMQKHVSYRDSRAATSANGGKVWTPKPKSETDEESYNTRLQVQAGNLPNHDKCEVLIGSISVALGDRSSRKQDEDLGGAPESCSLELPMPSEICTHEKPNKIEASIGNRSTVKLWRPVSRHENGDQFAVQNSNDASEVGSVSCDDSGEVQLVCSTKNNFSGREENLNSCMEGGCPDGLRFSRHVAEAFLAKRWKEAITSDHVKLVLFPEPEPPPDDNQQKAVSSSKLEHRRVLTSAENRLSGYYSTLESSAAMKPKIRAKPDKGSKVKYIPKQRSLT